MKVGRRLAIKMLNASKFVLGVLDGQDIPQASAITEPMDLDLLGLLHKLVSDATVSFENYDYARVLERAESFFWKFCDDYVELVKVRAYGKESTDGTESARATLALTLSVLQRLFAPFIPFATEEVWSWWHEGSVHVAPWPQVSELPAAANSTNTGEILLCVSEVLEAVRREKSVAKVSQRTKVVVCSVSAPEAFIASVKLGLIDLTHAGSIEGIEFAVSDEVVVAVELAAAEA